MAQQIVKKSGTRIPPNNIDSERALLGSIMLRPEAIHEIMEIIQEGSFYAEKHRIIFQAMSELFSKGEPIDLLTLSARLSEKNQLEQINGTSYLTELVNLVPSSANAEHYAEIVQKKYIMRQLIEASEQISMMGYDEAEDISALLDQAEKKIYEVTQGKTSNKFVQIKDVLGEAWERLDKLHKSKDEMRGVPTGFKDLDAKLSGLQKSDLIILAARPSTGKTSFALDIARNAAIRHNIPVIVFSLEMANQQLVDRMMAAEAKVDAWKLRTGGLKLDSDFDKIRDSLDVLSKAPIYVDDQPANNILKMRGVVRRLKNEKGIGLIIVDYLQLMAPVSSKNSDNVVQQVTEISRSLKHLAREFDVPVLALSQLSRAVEQRGGRPRLSDLRDSGSIEQDADVVLFLHREDKYKEEAEKTNIVEVLIEKHRNGPTGMASLYFEQTRSSFMDLDKNSDFKDFGGSNNDGF
jgi:replicative DNA helicase